MLGVGASDHIMKSFRELRVWQASMDLVEDVYRITRSFPKTETYGLTSQIQRAAVSIPSNIAEGHHANISKSTCITFRWRKLRWRKSRRSLKSLQGLATSPEKSCGLFLKQQARSVGSSMHCAIAYRVHIT